ncbi:FAD-dependent oxidoreductase, partial [Diaphorobacter nitroreducens]
MTRFSSRSSDRLKQGQQVAPLGAARRFAVVGAGMAGVACARTLAQAGHMVTVFEKAPQPGGR